MYIYIYILYIRLYYIKKKVHTSISTKTTLVSIYLPAIPFKQTHWLMIQRSPNPIPTHQTVSAKSPPHNLHDAVGNVSGGASCEAYEVGR